MALRIPFLGLRISFRLWCSKESFRIKKIPLFGHKRFFDIYFNGHMLQDCLYSNSVKIPILNWHINFIVSKIESRSFSSLLRASRYEEVVIVSVNGMGDYLYLTPAIEAFKKEHPKIKLHLAVSSNYDNWNNPMVYDFGKRNPFFDSVYYFDGIPSNIWHEYNWDAAIKNFNFKKTLFIPFFYKDQQDLHRVFDCFNLLNLKFHKSFPSKPQLYLLDKDYEKAKTIYQKLNLLDQDVVFLHLDTRSSNYHYPEAEELIKGLVARKKLVIIIGSNKEYANTHTLLIKDYTIFEISALLDICRNHAEIISVTSVFWGISSAIGIKNLGFYILNDNCARFYYDNLWIITSHLPALNFIPRKHVAYLPPKSILNENGMFDYKANDILEFYDEVKLLSRKQP